MQRAKPKFYPVRTEVDFPSREYIASIGILDDAVENGECLELRPGWSEATQSWIGDSDRRPYVTLRGHGHYSVQRLIYYEQTGRLPTKIYRSCHNRYCINPDHLTDIRPASDYRRSVHERTLPRTDSQLEWYVYRLRCPLTTAVRYIGMSSNPRERFRQHCSKHQIHSLQEWCNYLRQNGEFPRMELFAGPVELETAAQIESAMIVKTKQVPGHQLLNRVPR